MPHKTETWIVLKDKKILRVYKTSQGEPGIIASLKYEGITDFDERRKVTDFFEGVKGMDIRELTTKGKLRPLVDRIKEGYRPLDPNYKIEKDEIVEKTLKEKIDDGLVQVDAFQVYDEETQELRPKTQDELLRDGLITQAQIDAQERARLIQEEITKIAEERLIASGKIAAKV